MASKIFFCLLAFVLFIIIFFKIIRRNDTTYIISLVMQAIGIGINFIEITFRIFDNVILNIIMYIFSIILPIVIIALEYRNINFTEILSVATGKILLTFGNTKAAKAILSKLVDKYPDSYIGHKMLAEIYEKEGGMRKAIDEYVTAIDINKKDYASYYKIAELLKDLDKKDESIEMLQNLIKNKPDFYEASTLLGELLCEQERFKEAVTVYSDALTYRPNDYDLYYSLGIVHTRLNDFQSAKECYAMAAEINHRLYGAYYNLAQISLIQKDLDAAEKFFTESLFDEELEPRAYYQLAKIYMIKEERDKAITFANKAIELDSSLLKVISSESLFEPIKQFITVSVNMNEKEETIEEENSEETSKEEKKKEEERAVIDYLEETARLIDDINENTVKYRISEKVDKIINNKINKDDQEKEMDNFE